MGGLDSQSAHYRTLKKHQKELRILPGGHHGAPYAYVLHWFCRIYGKSWQNMEQYSDQGGAKSTTRTFSFRFGGLTFGKKKSEAWFYWASDRVIRLFWVLPDSNIIKYSYKCIKYFREYQEIKWRIFSIYKNNLFLPLIVLYVLYFFVHLLN